MAAPPHAMEEPDAHNRYLSYIRTDADLPPVAIVDRSPIGTRHKIAFGVIAVLGAAAWAIVAFARGETVNAVRFVVAAICTYVIGYRFSHQLSDVIRNTFVQGTLSALFAAVVVILFVSAIIVVSKEIRGDGRPLTEDDPVPSRMFAPSGMISTAEEREVQRQWHALNLAPTGQSGSAASPAESPGIGAT